MSILAVEELSRVDASAGVIVDVQNTLVNNALMRWGNETQRNRYLPTMASGMLGAYALSEAGSGSDAFALKTRAELKGDRYVLNGQKLWITNAVEADLFILFATVDPALGYKGITAFIVEKSFPGFQVGKKEDKLGIRASSTCELILENCEVPRENVLGEVGKGYKVSIETLNEGRIGIGAQMIGLASGALECWDSIRQRTRTIRPAHRPVPGDSVSDCGAGHAVGGSATARVQRRAPQGCPTSVRQGGGHGKVLQFTRC